MRPQRATTLVLTGLAALANAALAIHLISYSRSLRWDSQDAEWESSYDPISIRLDAVKLVWAILSIHFSLAALACIIGFFGALKVRPMCQLRCHRLNSRFCVAQPRMGSSLPRLFCRRPLL